MLLQSVSNCNSIKKIRTEVPDASHNGTVFFTSTQNPFRKKEKNFKINTKLTDTLESTKNRVSPLNVLLDAHHASHTQYDWIRLKQTTEEISERLQKGQLKMIYKQFI